MAAARFSGCAAKELLGQGKDSRHSEWVARMMVNYSEYIFTIKTGSCNFDILRAISSILHGLA